MTVGKDSENPCRRWLVLVACFVCHMTTASMSYHAGVLHVALLHTFRRDVITTAWLGSMYASIPTLTGPVASLVITTFDCRTCLIMSGVLAAVGASSCFFITQFYLLYPALIVAGIGQGFSLISSYVAIGYNFPYQASLLTGICVCGSGLGIFIHPPLLHTLVSYFGFHGAMLVLGAVSLNAVACGMAVPPSRYEKQRQRQRQRQLAGSKQLGPAEPGSDDATTSSSLTPPRTSSRARFLHNTSLRSLTEVLGDFRFLLLLVTSLGFSSAMACYYIYLPDFLLNHRYDQLTASFVLSITGMGSIPSRLLTGVLSNDAAIDTTTFFFGIHALAALSTLLVPFTVYQVGWQMALAAMFGVYTGAVWACCSPLLLELLGVRRVAHGVGLYLFTMGIGYIAGPPLAARLYTLTGNFDHIFYFTTAMFAMASAAAMMSTLIRPKGEHPQSLRSGAWHQSAEMVSPEGTTDPGPQTAEPLLSTRNRCAAHNVIVTADINPQTVTSSV